MIIYQGRQQGRDLQVQAGQEGQEMLLCSVAGLVRKPTPLIIPPIKRRECGSVRMIRKITLCKESVFMVCLVIGYTNYR